VSVLVKYSGECSSEIHCANVLVKNSCECYGEVLRVSF
jgi:hypothetical protein